MSFDNFFLYFLLVKNTPKLNEANFTEYSFQMLEVLIKVFKKLLTTLYQGAYKGGARGARPPCPHRQKGGTHVGAHLILHLLAFPLLRQFTFYIALHCNLHSPKLKD